MKKTKMINIQKILNTIDLSKMVKDISFQEMCEEFEIYDWIYQDDKNIRLTYCYYHQWICTDTLVGIRVWYFDNKPVCISWKPYRKYDETFAWINNESYEKVKEYAFSLINIPETNYVKILTDKIINDIVDEFNSIDYKKFEKRNVILDN